MKQDRVTPVPAYRQIAQRLIEDIGAGRLAHGERLPPEREMAAGLGVAVGTLRKALGILEGRGLVERRQGSGNYVRGDGARDPAYAMFRLELAEGGGRPTSRVLGMDVAPKPASLPAIGPSALACRIRRLRCLDGRPAALEEIWLDARHADAIRSRDLSGSLYDLYRQDLGIWISRVDDRITVGAAPAWAPSASGIKPGDPAGFVARMAWDQDGARVEASSTWFDPATAHYASRLK